ncbi:hypothetical protein THAOC_03889, partial [Thalassiosira oceanica]
KEDVKAARTRRILLGSDNNMSLAEEQHQPPAPAVPAAGPLPDAVTEEELMNSGHELHESHTCPLCCLADSVARGDSLQVHALLHEDGMQRLTPTPDSDAARLALVRKRVDAKDPVATEFLASSYYDGKYGLQPDIPLAVELWTEAAHLGDLHAHYKLGYRYYYGEGVEKDMDRGVRHCQHAAIQGHPTSRHALGIHECDEGNHELAVRHWMISAKLGLEESLNEIKEMFIEGHAKKAQYAEALKGYQNALEETKSPQREEAKACFNGCD